jgi:hypothetical protein
MVGGRVARWFILKPKIPIWIILESPILKMLIYFCNLGYLMDVWDIWLPFGTFCVHLAPFSGFGIMYQEKSGNPGRWVWRWVCGRWVEGQKINIHKNGDERIFAPLIDQKTSKNPSLNIHVLRFGNYSSGERVKTLQIYSTKKLAWARGVVDRAPVCHLGDLGSNLGQANFLQRLMA